MARLIKERLISHTSSPLHALALSFFPTVRVCIFMRTTHEVREDMGPLVVTVMCNTPSEDPFTLIVRTSDGSAVGEQMNV